MDFFGGSGTTAQAVLDLNKDDGGNRKFIICEQMDYIDLNMFDHDGDYYNEAISLSGERV